MQAADQTKQDLGQWNLQPRGSSQGNLQRRGSGQGNVAGGHGMHVPPSSEGNGADLENSPSMAPPSPEMYVVPMEALPPLLRAQIIRINPGTGMPSFAVVVNNTPPIVNQRLQQLEQQVVLLLQRQTKLEQELREARTTMSQNSPSSPAVTAPTAEPPAHEVSFATKTQAPPLEAETDTASPPTSEQSECAAQEKKETCQRSPTTQPAVPPTHTVAQAAQTQTSPAATKKQQSASVVLQKKLRQVSAAAQTAEPPTQQAVPQATKKAALAPVTKKPQSESVAPQKNQTHVSAAAAAQTAVHLPHTLRHRQPHLPLRKHCGPGKKKAALAPAAKKASVVPATKKRQSESVSQQKNQTQESDDAAQTAVPRTQASPSDEVCVPPTTTKIVCLEPGTKKPAPGTKKRKSDAPADTSKRKKQYQPRPAAWFHATKKPKPSSQAGFGADRCGFRNSLFKDLSVHNTYITGPLSEHQKSWVLQAYRQLMTEETDLRNMPAQQVHERVALIFNNWHLAALARDTRLGGFGGKIRTESVKACLQQAAKPMVQQQVQAQAAKLACGRHVPIPTKHQIDQMGQKALRRHLKQVGEVQHGLTEELRTRLKQHYNL